MTTSSATRITTNFRPTRAALPAWRRISRPRLGAWKSGGYVNNPRTFDIDDLKSCSTRKSAFTACAAWKPGPWSFPGSAFRCTSCLKWSNPPRMPASCASKRFTTPTRCPDSATRSSPSPTSKGCVWTKANARPDHHGPPVCTAATSVRRTAPRCAWWCPGNMASNPSRALSRSTWWVKCPLRCGWHPARASTASTLTSTPTCPTRVGRRPPNAALAKVGASIRCCSTAMKTKSHPSMMAWDLSIDF